MDSANGVRDIIKFGTTSNCDTHELCREIFNLCRKFLITLQPEWVPRELNKRADALSKKFDRAAPNTTTRKHLIRNFGDHPTVVPILTKVGTTLKGLSLAPSPVIAIYPLWRTQSWWPSLQHQAHNQIELGPFSKIFEADGSINVPSWVFGVGLIKNDSPCCKKKKKILNTAFHMRTNHTTEGRRF
jgi:hypothetical protein